MRGRWLLGRHSSLAMPTRHTSRFCWREPATQIRPLAILIEAHVLLFTGRAVDARQGLTACLRVDPRGPDSHWAMHQFAISYYFEGDYLKSVEAARRALARHPEVSGPTDGSRRRWAS